MLMHRGLEQRELLCSLGLIWNRAHCMGPVWNRGSTVLTWNRGVLLCSLGQRGSTVLTWNRGVLLCSLGIEGFYCAHLE